MGLSKLTLSQIFRDNQPLWDRPQSRLVVRENFHKVVNCRTPELGAEIYASDNGERKVFAHTCKSIACPSCGQRATLRWQREVAVRLPDIPYAGVTLTMPDVFWPIFKRNRHLLDGLAVIGAGVLQDWADKICCADVTVLVVRHTFNPKLDFNPHLHILVSTVGLHRTGRELIGDIRFSLDGIREWWRRDLLDYLTMALKDGQLASELASPKLMQLFEKHRDMWWSVKVDYFRTKDAFLNYISRYLRRPPLAEYRLLSSNGREVSFSAKDKRLGQRVTITYSNDEFINRLSAQVPERYEHGVRYFGLLAPRSIAKRYEVFLALLGQSRPPRPRRFCWADSVHRTFGQNPLLDSDGKRMYWIGRIPPGQT